MLFVLPRRAIEFQTAARSLVAKMQERKMPKDGAKLTESSTKSEMLHELNQLSPRPDRSHRHHFEDCSEPGCGPDQLARGRMKTPSFFPRLGSGNHGFHRFCTEQVTVCQQDSM